MTTISSLIQALTEILANHGDLTVTLTNDITGEIRYVDGIEINEDCGDINLTHISYGEAKVAEQIEMWREVLGDLDFIVLTSEDL